MKLTIKGAPSEHNKIPGASFIWEFYLPQSNIHYKEIEKHFLSCVKAYEPLRERLKDFNLIKTEKEDAPSLDEEQYYVISDTDLGDLYIFTEDYELIDVLSSD